MADEISRSITALQELNLWFPPMTIESENVSPQYWASKWYFHNQINKIRLASMTQSLHYNNVIMSAMASQITSLTIVYSSVYSGEDQRKHQSSASLAFVRGIHRWPANSPHKGQWRGDFMFSLICALHKSLRLVIWDAIVLIMTSL